MAFTITHDDGVIFTDDTRRLDVARAHAWIAGSYWATGIPLDTFVRSVRNSIAIGAYDAPARSTRASSEGGASAGAATSAADRRSRRACDDADARVRARRHGPRDLRLARGRLRRRPWLADVYVDDAHRGRGLGKRLVAYVRAHPDLQGLRRFHLATNDAHGLYAQAGFVPLTGVDRWMEIRDPHVYTRGRAP